MYCILHHYFVLYMFQWTEFLFQNEEDEQQDIGKVEGDDIKVDIMAEEMKAFQNCKIEKYRARWN